MTPRSDPAGNADVTPSSRHRDVPISSGLGVAISDERVYANRMFETLAAAIDEMNIPVDGDAVVEAFALRDRLDAKLALAAGELDAVELWDADGPLRSRPGCATGPG